MKRRGPRFEDVAVGESLPALSRGPVTIQDLVEWCAAENDFLAIHYDATVAKRSGLPGPIIQGSFKWSLLAKMLSHWLERSGTLRRLAAQYRGMDFPGDVITARGKVTKKYIQEGQGYIELEVWVENQRGERNTPGTATVILPLRPH